MQSDTQSTSVSSAGNPVAFKDLLEIIVANFTDVSSCDVDFDIIYPGMDMSHPDYIGANTSLPEEYFACVSGFLDEVMNNRKSKYYRLDCIGNKVARYMTYFDVKPNGPDLMKYFLGFGLSFDHYMMCRADRPIVRMMGRMRTIRMLHAAAAMHRSDHVGPPQVMMRKIFRIWKDVDVRREFMGLYGTYLVFKTWSLGG